MFAVRVSSHELTFDTCHRLTCTRAYFDRLSLKRPCRICPQVFCGRCDYQLQTRAFNARELFSELPSRVIEEEVCAKCKKVIDKMRRKSKWQLIQEQFAAKYSNYLLVSVG